MGYEIPLSQGLTLKIDAAPSGNNGYPTARLQKGLLLLDQGQDLAEEAVGFGVPVLKHGLQTLFPGAVKLTCFQRGTTQEITMLFKLNLVETISRRGNGILESRSLYAIKDLLAAIIRRLPIFRGFLTAISSWMRQAFDWETTYTEAESSAEVKVFFTLDGQTGKINAEIDTSGLPPGITEVMVMNEQGAHPFDRYGDSTGVSLLGEEIGCWDEVTADEAWFESGVHRVRFGLSQVKGARLFRGRELVDTRLAWAGFGYSFSPELKKLQYAMKIEKLA